MVQKLGFIFLGLIAIVAIGGLLVQLQNTMTGEYYASGGGRWYYGPMRAQMQPDEACIYAGLVPVYPQQVYRNEYGLVLSVCQQGDQRVGVPLTQTVLVR